MHSAPLLLTLSSFLEDLIKINDVITTDSFSLADISFAESDSTNSSAEVTINRSASNLSTMSGKQALPFHLTLVGKLTNLLFIILSIFKKFQEPLLCQILPTAFRATDSALPSIPKILFNPKIQPRKRPRSSTKTRPQWIAAKTSLTQI